jgi:hypothetical protein
MLSEKQSGLPMPIPPNSTIETVYDAGALASPAGYTRVILERMNSYRFMHRLARVRIESP